MRTISDREKVLVALAVVVLVAWGGYALLRRASTGIHAADLAGPIAGKGVKEGLVVATDRRIALKMTDDDVDRVILLVADTRRNRRVLREFRELLRERYPLETREILTALQEGRLPSKSGIAVL